MTLFVSLILVLLSYSIALPSETTTGGVNFVDSLSYTKPQFYPISYPSEAECGSNVYYVDRASGSGSTCSQVSPCAWSGLSGKAGMTGGPARIYLKGGTANMSISSYYGSAGNEIVIKPWPGDSTTARFDSGGSYGNRFDGSAAYIVFDGGPDMQFTFNSVGGSGQTNYNLTTDADNLTFYRCKFDNNGNSGPNIGPAVGSGASATNNKWINCEIFDSLQYYGVYAGGGSACPGGSSTYSGLYFLNNVFRDICGRGIQLEPRTSGTNAYVTGNAFHNVGKGCSAVPSPSACVQPAGACGASISGTYVYNNLMFDIAGGVHNNGETSSVIVYNNTIYDYGNTSYSASVTGHALACYEGSMTARNNIILVANDGHVSMNRCTFTRSNNICDDGNCSGTASTASAEFLSTSTSSSDYLKQKNSGQAYQAGYNLSGTFTSSYFGDTRAVAFDIGADEYGESGDTTAPSVSITTSDPSTITSNALTVTGTASDAVGVSSCKYRIGSAPDGSNGTACTGTTSWSCSTSGYSVGSNTLYVGCGDAAGNWGSDSITVNFTPVPISGINTSFKNCIIHP